jgi:catechol 2,3-dioxygenase-like lactoylglutathione lyase family enzyme
VRGPDREVLLNPVLEAVHPVLMSRDIAESIGFFERLGFSVAFRDGETVPRYAGVARDGVTLHLQWHDAGQWAYPGDRPAYRFLVGDVDALYRELQERGAVADPEVAGSPWGRPGDTPWGTREFHLRDPSGNLLQFYSLPS